MNKKKVLVVIDMQNDFINGSLKNQKAEAIVPTIADFIQNFDGYIIATRDTHYKDYLDTTEGQYLPVEHCIKNTFGHQIHRDLLGYKDFTSVVDKENFGSVQLAYEIADLFNHYEVEKYADCEIHLVGTCTDICVVSNALVLKTILPDVKIIVHKNMVAGLDEAGNESALLVMQRCQCEVVD